MPRITQDEHRGFTIVRRDRPSKNHRIGNVLTFWDVPGLPRPRYGAQAGTFAPLDERDVRAFNSRPEAKRAIDGYLDAGGPAAIVSHP